MCSIFGSHSSQNSKSNTVQNSTSTTTPNVPQWIQDRWNDTNKTLDTAGMTPDQREVANWLMSNMGDTTNKDTAVDAAHMGTDALTAANASAAPALTAANASGSSALSSASTSGAAALNKATGAGDSAIAKIGDFTGGIGANGDTINSAVDFLKNQLGNGSNTLGHWFGDQVPSSANVTAAGAQSANVAPVTAGTGAAFMGSYSSPLNNDYVNASLADYDAGAAQGFNALRAQNASAFGNKRTGVAEGQFMADSARGRGALSASTRLNAFNTAAGLGSTDASRALAADTTTAGNLLNNNQLNANLAQANNQFNASNLLNNNQYNAGMTDSRQKFDVGEADSGDARRQQTATNIIAGAQTGAGVNSAGVNAAATGANVASNNFTNTLNYGNSGVSNAVNVGNSAVSNAVNVGNSGVSNAVNVGNSGVTNSINAGDSALRSALASGNFQNMTMQQLMALLQSGGMGIGSTTNSNGTSSTTGSGSSTSFGASGNPFAK